MAIPNSRKTLIDYCKRRLGYPVIDINVDDDQVEDRIDDALQFFQDYHTDAMQQVYVSHYVTQNDVDNRYLDMTMISGYAVANSGANTLLGVGTYFLNELTPGVSRITVNGDNRLVVAIQDNHHLTVDTNWANTTLNSPISVPAVGDAVIGVTRIFPVASTNATVNMFDLRYQLRLHELYDFTSTSYVNYVLTQQHLRTLDMLFSGEAPLRFNRHQNKLFIDFIWGQDIQVGEFLILETWQIVDPDAFPAVYNDRYLKALATAHIKRQWGINLIKFGGVPLPGGIILNGQAIFDEAQKEIEELEGKIQSYYETPPEWIIG